MIIYFPLLFLILGICAQNFTVNSVRGGDNPVLWVTLNGKEDYNYVPTLMADGKYRIWWCAGLSGDYIWYSESTSLDSGWSTPIHVFGPTGNPSDFDGTHTCDPSVLRVEGTLYLYYGGCCGTNPNSQTAVGLAISTDDGTTWQRANGGKAIVSGRGYRTDNKYGAGQPSVVYVDGYFYMVYTDTTGIDSGGSGNVNYVLRSTDPTFSTAEELVATGFVPSTPTIHTTHNFFPCVSVDWLYSDLFNIFAVGCDGYTTEATRLRLFSQSLLTDLGYVDIPGHWTEGPGLLTRPDGHALFLPTVPSSVPVDVMRSVGPAGPFTWKLAHNGANLNYPGNVSVPYAQLLEGSIMNCPGMPLTIVVGGQRLQFALAAPVNYLARNGYTVSTGVYESIPFGASVYQGQKVVGAPDRPAAFLMADGRAWPISCLEVITSNGSNIQGISQAEFDALPKGPSLYCL